MTLASDSVPSNNGWTQECYTGPLGQSFSFWTKDGYVFDLPKFGVQDVATAPGWSVVSFNAKRKLFFVHKQDKAMKMHSVLAVNALYEGPPPSGKWTSHKTVQYLGHPAELWRTPENTMPKVPSDSTKFRGYELWLLQDVDIPMAMAQYNARLYHFPLKTGLPARLLRIIPQNKPKVLLETIRLARCYIPKTKFVTPVGYKETHEERDVGFDTTNLQTLIEDLGLGEAPK